MNPALVTRKRTVPESAYDAHVIAISIKPASNMAAPHFTAREKPNIIASLPFVILTTVTPASPHLQGRTRAAPSSRNQAELFATDIRRDPFDIRIQTTSACSLYRRGLCTRRRSRR